MNSPERGVTRRRLIVRAAGGAFAGFVPILSACSRSEYTTTETIRDFNDLLHGNRIVKRTFPLRDHQGQGFVTVEKRRGKEIRETGQVEFHLKEGALTQPPHGLSFETGDDLLPFRLYVKADPLQRMPDLVLGGYTFKLIVDKKQGPASHTTPQSSFQATREVSQAEAVDFYNSVHVLTVEWQRWNFTKVTLDGQEIPGLQLLANIPENILHIPENIPHTVRAPFDRRIRQGLPVPTAVKEK